MSLQTELQKIGTELQGLSKPRSHRSGTLPSSIDRISNLQTLSMRIKDFETKQSSTLTDLSTRTSAIATDLESSLLVSEKRAKRLDELYREANAENEALYMKFNEELLKVVKGVKMGEGEQEVQRKLKEALEEVGRLKRENAKLKRENVGLRAQLRGD